MLRNRDISRRQLLTRGAAALAALGGVATGADLLLLEGEPKALRSFATNLSHPVRTFHSRPGLHPPVVTAAPVTTVTEYLFLAPWPARSSHAGPLIVDQRGEVVWFRPAARNRWVTNAGVQDYRGEPALVWWEGEVIAPGYGRGEGVVVDSSYHELRRVRAGNGRHADMHELRLTPQGTALITCYPPTVTADLRGVGGPRNGTVQESVIQEVDLRSGRVLLEWRSLEHVGVSESYFPLHQPYDYFHVNSIEVAPDGNLLISARNTHTIYKLDRRTGQVMWRLGGKRSDFTMGPDTTFAWQHDARVVGENTITLFDDECDGPITSGRQSRAIVLELDADRRTARLVRSYTHPEPLLTTAMGNVQLLGDGRVLVGWGTASCVSQFAADGTLISDLRLPKGRYSYRAFGASWRSAPAHDPAVAARRDPRSGEHIVYASWNGATEVSHWQLDGGLHPERLAPVGVARRRGFETAIRLPSKERYVAVTALDASGNRLGRSGPVHVWS
jgi:outer membrane protein assembly factor BamB